MRRCARAFKKFFDPTDHLMEACLDNLRERPLPPFTAPPDDVKQHIEDRLAPLAADAETPQKRRVRAIRALGLLGYP